MHRTSRPLDQEELKQLALAYVARYATTRAKLDRYLTRKLRERGWAGEVSPDVSAISQRLEELRYLDDEAYALGKTASLKRKGFGARRISASLRFDGISEEITQNTSEINADEALELARHFAERKRIGPYFSGIPDPKQFDRWLAAMQRGGHPLQTAFRVLRSRLDEKGNFCPS